MKLILVFINFQWFLILENLQTSLEQDLSYALNIKKALDTCLTSQRYLINLDCSNNVTLKKIVNTLKNYYKKDFFVNIHKPNTQIGTGSVIETNNCDISVCQTRLKNKIVIFSSIDNLIKGAAGQAVQNMNIMFNLSQTRGLKWESYYFYHYFSFE